MALYLATIPARVGSRGSCVGIVTAGKAKEIENAAYDLKAVNPNKKPVVDTRTPEELLDIIEAKGQEVAEALAALRRAPQAESLQTVEQSVGAVNPSTQGFLSHNIGFPADCVCG